MSLLIGPAADMGRSTPYAQEMRKHEALHTAYGPPGRPYVYREYPTMMYRPTQAAKGGPLEFEGQEAGSDMERSSLESQGFYHGGRAAAAECFYARQTEIAELAANRAFLDRKMSPEAQAEAQGLDDTTVNHLPAIEQAHPKTGRRDR